MYWFRTKSKRFKTWWTNSTWLYITLRWWKEKFWKKEFSFYLETRGSIYSKSEILGIGLYDGDNGYFISKDEIDNYKELFASDIEKSTYDLKKCIVVLNNLGININNVTFDSMIGTYLLDYVVKDDISFVARSFDYDITPYEELYGTEKRPKELELDELKKVCCLNMW